MNVEALFEAWRKSAGFGEETGRALLLLRHAFMAGYVTAAAPPWLEWDIARDTVKVDGVSVSHATFAHLRDTANEGRTFQLVKAADADGTVTLKDERQVWEWLGQQEEALRVIAEALKEPAGGSYWPAREFLEKHDKFHDDLSGERVLLRVAEIALGKAEAART